MAGIGVIHRNPGAWGLGQGYDLSAAKIDGNFYAVELAITALESVTKQANNISRISTDQKTITFTLENGDTWGPLPLPIFRFRWRGDWTPLTHFSPLDIFRVLGSGIYLVLGEDLSGASFDPNFADSTGPLYQLVFGLGDQPSLAGIGDVSFSSPAVDDFFVYNGADWTNEPPTEVLGLLGITDTLAGLKDVEIDSNLVDGQAVVWNDGLKRWIPATPWQFGDSSLDDFNRLSGLSDVAVSNPVDGQALVWNNGLGKWVAARPWQYGASAFLPPDRLSELSDVLIESTPRDGDVLSFDGHLEVWTHRQDHDYLAQLLDVDIGSGPADDEMLRFDAFEGKWAARERPSPFNFRGAWDPEAAYIPGDVTLVDLSSGTSIAVLNLFPILAPSDGGGGGGGGGSGGGPPPSIDVTAHDEIHASSGTTDAITTSSSDQIIIIIAANDSGTQRNVASITGGGLLFQQRSVHNTNNGNWDTLEVWWAAAIAPLVSQSFTITWDGTPDDSVYLIYTVSGCDMAQPWDTNASLPLTQDGSTNPTNLVFSTDSANTFVITAGMSHAGTTAEGGISDPNWIQGPEHLGGGGGPFLPINSHYRAFNTVQAGTTAAWATGGASVYMLDALRGTPALNPPPQEDPGHWFAGEAPFLSFVP